MDPNNQNGNNGQPNNNPAPTPIDTSQFAKKEEISSLLEEVKGIKDLLLTEDEPDNNQPDPNDKWAAFDKQPPKSYKELRDAIVEDTLTEAERKKQEAEQAEQAKLAEIQKQKDDLNKRWDDQIASLEKDGKLPPVKDPKNKDDEGVKARVQLYQTALELGASDLIKVYDKAIAPAKAVTQTPTKTKPAGAAAPVGTPNAANNGPQAKERLHSDLKVPIDEVRAKYFPELYQ